MGLFKIGAEVCNNCIHWECYTERKFRGNPPTEVYTRSNRDKCRLTGQYTISERTCPAFVHIGGVTKTFAYIQEPSVSDMYLEGVMGGLATICQRAQERLEHAVAQSEAQQVHDAQKRDILIRNGMDASASEQEQQEFEVLYKGACDGDVEGLLYLGEAFRTKRYGAVLDVAKAIKLFKMAAGKGSVVAERMVASCYFMGDSSDMEMGWLWLKRAADHGDAIACQKVASMEELKRRSRMVQEQAERAKAENERRARLIEEQKARERAYKNDLAKYAENEGMDPAVGNMAKLLFSVLFENAKDGSLAAQLELADAYANNDKGAIRDYDRAMFWYMKAAEQGSSLAQFEVGKIYCSGKGKVKDERLGVEWFRKAAESGNVDAQEKLGELYYNGTTEIARDCKEAVKWLRLAAKNGRVSAMLMVAKCYDQGAMGYVNLDEAIEWYDMAAKKENASARVRLASLAIDTRDLAKQGDPAAQNRLGRLFELGAGVRKDAEVALQWYKIARGNGSADAMANIGHCYLRGSCVDRDEELSATWFLISAQKGCRKAQRLLARCYKNGVGVKADEEVAAEWLRISNVEK